MEAITHAAAAGDHELVAEMLSQDHLALIRIGRSGTVLRWARLGELPSIQLSNRAIRFVRSEIEEWMRSRARTTRRNGAHPA